MSTDYTDEELVQYYNRSVTAEEANAYLEELLGRYRRKVIYWCYHMTGRSEEAFDLTQEIFLKVFKNLDTFRGNSRFSTWLYQIARNHCSDFLRQKRRELFQPLEEAVEHPAARAHPSVDQRLDRQETLQTFMTLVDTLLTDMEKKVAYMHFADGLKLPEITRLLALTNKSGAKAYLVSAKRKLQERMGRWLQSRNLNISDLFP